MNINTKEGSLNANVYGSRVGIMLATLNQHFLIENVSFLSDGDQNDMDTLQALLESDVATANMHLNLECLDVSIISVRGEVMFSVLDKCGDQEPEHIVLTVHGKSQLHEVIRRSKGLNHTV